MGHSLPWAQEDCWRHFGGATGRWWLMAWSCFIHRFSSSKRSWHGFQSPHLQCQMMAMIARQWWFYTLKTLWSQHKVSEVLPKGSADLWTCHWPPKNHQLDCETSSVMVWSLLNRPESLCLYWWHLHAFHGLFMGLSINKVQTNTSWDHREALKT